MERSWQRADPVEPLSPDEVADLLGGSGLTAVRCEPIAEGLANANYRLEDADGGRWLLRRYRRDPASLGLETTLLRKMAGRIPVSTVRFADPARGVVVLEFLPGRTLQSVLAEGNPDEARAAAPTIGTTLAEIAAHPYGSAGLLDANGLVADAWPSVYDGLSGFLEHGSTQPTALGRAGAGRLDRVRRCWLAHEAALRAATAFPCLSHGDFKPANLLIHEGKLTGVLDWEFAHAGTWLMDAGQLLRYLGPLRAVFAQAVEQARRRRGLPVPDAWEALARLVDTASLVDFLGRPETGERQTADVLTLLDESLALLERA
ncbi:MAG: phosphotransferase [Fimbriimonadaceae bacterium]|nr:phosphotransferase [Fimbriimonadaceae bacterium]